MWSWDHVFLVIALGVKIHVVRPWFLHFHFFKFWLSKRLKPPATACIYIRGRSHPMSADLCRRCAKLVNLSAREYLETERERDRQPGERNRDRVDTLDTKRGWQKRVRRVTKTKPAEGNRPLLRNRYLYKNRYLFNILYGQHLDNTKSTLPQWLVTLPQWHITNY